MIRRPSGSQFGPTASLPALGSALSALPSAFIVDRRKCSLGPPGSQCCVKTIRDPPGAQLASVALWSLKCVIWVTPVPSP